MVRENLQLARGPVGRSKTGAAGCSPAEGRQLVALARAVAAAPEADRSTMRCEFLRTTVSD
jgi:hypothetical protein